MTRKATASRHGTRSLSPIVVSKPGCDRMPEQHGHCDQQPNQQNQFHCVHIPSKVVGCRLSGCRGAFVLPLRQHAVRSWSRLRHPPACFGFSRADQFHAMSVPLIRTGAICSTALHWRPVLIPAFLSDGLWASFQGRSRQPALATKLSRISLRIRQFRCTPRGSRSPVPFLSMPVSPRHAGSGCLVRTLADAMLCDLIQCPHQDRLPAGGVMSSALCPVGELRGYPPVLGVQGDALEVDGCRLPKR